MMMRAAVVAFLIARYSTASPARAQVGALADRKLWIPLWVSGG
jgi:hypothetical protein